MTKPTRKGRRVSAHALSQAKSPTSSFCMEFVLDETGSMSRIRGQTIAGFNEFVAGQNVENAGSARMTLSKFEGGKVITPYQDLNLSFVPKMTTDTYKPGGGTNLFDAVGHRITETARRLEQWTEQPNVLIIVMTDGGDTCSTRYSPASLGNLIAKYRNAGWGFAYLGSDSRALSIGESMGFRDGEIRCFKNEHIADTFRELTSSTVVYRTATVAGTAATMFK